MFPELEGKMCCILLKGRDKCFWWSLHIKNEIWLLIVTDTYNLPNMPGDSEPNSEIGCRKDIEET